MDTIGNVVIEVGDRAAAMKDGKMLKGRVAVVVDSQIGVTFAKDATPTLYDRVEVMPLYRYIGSGVFILCSLPVTAGE